MMKNSGALFQRHEKKYRLTQEQYQSLLPYMERFWQQDAYGTHTVCSIYYDTPDYAVIRHSIGHPDFKEKLRLRSYGVPRMEDTVYLELKKKLDGVTYKRRMPMTLRQAEDYLHNGVKPELEGQTFGEIDWYVGSKPLSPKAVVCCERIALYGQDGFRVTFDANIRWRNYAFSLSRGDHGTPLLESGCVLMEIKTQAALPYHLSRRLSELGVYAASFSKYGTVYREHLMNTEVVLCAG